MTKDIDEGVTGKTVPGRPWRELYDKKEKAFREKKQQDYAKQKGFNIKRDKGGKGFSMMIGKKIKGFEEGADMDKTNIDEAEGIKTVSTKGYSGSKPKAPQYRPSTKGYINFKNKQPASDADRKVLDYHKGEAAKEGKVVQLRYRGPRSHEGRQTYNPAASQTRGAATGAAIYYKNKSELGGRQREAARKNRANEDYDMNEDQLDETSKEKAQAYLRAAPRDLAAQEHQTGVKYAQGVRDDMKYHALKGKNRIEGIRRAVKKVSEEVEEQEAEVQEPVTEISDLIVHSIDQKPLDFQQTFADLMQQHIEDAVHDRKLEIASGFVANTEPVDVDFEDADPGDNDSDWDGTEYEPEEDDLTPGEPEEE
jgi:hypothetical protein